MNLHDIVQRIQFWSDAAGVRHPITEMDDGYLLNVLNYFGSRRAYERLGEERERMLESVREEARDRGIISY